MFESIYEALKDRGLHRIMGALHLFLSLVGTVVIFVLSKSAYSPLIMMGIGIIWEIIGGARVIFFCTRPRASVWERLTGKDTILDLIADAAGCTLGWVFTNGCGIF